MENTSKEYTIDEVREILSKKVKDFVSVTNNGSTLIIRSFTGSGKTTTILKTLDDLQLRYIYIAPNHDVIKENLSRSNFRSYKFLHIKGRKKCCLRKDLNHMLEKGLNIGYFCKKCEFKESCIYEINQKKAFKDKPNLGIVHAHINNWLPMFLNTETSTGQYIYEYYDVVVIDETPVNVFIPEMIISYNDLVAFRTCCREINLNKDIDSILQIIMNRPIDYDLLQKFEFTTNQQIKITKKFSKRVFKLYNNNTIDTIPKNILHFIFKILEGNHEKFKFMIYWSEWTGKLNLSYFNENALDFPIKLIGLDGTASKDVWDSMTGQDVEMFSIDYQYKNVYQLNGARYPITSWKYQNVVDKLTNMIDLIASKRKNKCLVIATKGVINIIRENTQSKNLIFAHYYNLRSKNEFYKQADTVILACEPNPPKEKIEACITLSGWNERTWVKIFRNEEMKQGLGRLRENISITVEGRERETRLGIIFPSTDVDDVSNYSNLLNEATVISYDLLKNELKGSHDILSRRTYEQVILEECPVSINQFSKKYDISRRKVGRYFRYLTMNGLIKKESRGIYEITKRGLSKASAKKKRDAGIKNILYQGSSN